MRLVDYNQIDNNIKCIRKNNDIVLVVKNNAYGFGLNKIVQIALKNNINSFAVNTIDEAIELRNITDNEILIFGYSIKNIDEIVKYNITPTANSYDEILIYRKFKIKYALEIDAGMNRFGIKEFDEDLFKDVYLNEVYIHFYDERMDFTKYISKIKRLCYKYNKKCHFGGSMLYSKTNEKLRIGKMIYSDSLKLYGNVVMIKSIKKGETVGYESLYKATKDEKIAVIDIGYFNGLKTNFNGYVCIKNIKYRIVGKVCMNHSFAIIDDNVYIGDIVEFFGDNINIFDFLEHNKMTEYECFLSIR